MNHYEKLFKENPALLTEAAYYQKQAKRLLTNPLLKFEVVEAFLKLVDESLKKIPNDLVKQIKCKKGCAFCCRNRVYVSLVEAQHIIHYCNSHGIAIDVDYLKEQAKLREDRDYHFTKFNKCVFLDENELCSIYKVRPLGCRKYFVVTDPKNCNMDGEPKQVTSIITTEADMMISGLMAADRASGNLPEMLLLALQEG